MIVELNALLLVDGGHVTADAVRLRRYGADDVRAFGRIMALDAMLDVLGLADFVDGAMRIMTGRALQALFGFEVTPAAQHANGLKSCQCIRIVA